MITGKMPDQLRLEFYLWTRQAVVVLVKREYGIELSLTTVGRYLKSWGMTAQKPVRRAYERKRRGHRALVQQDPSGACAPGQARACPDLLGR